MAEGTFTPIETQEQFDQAISARLQRERGKYEGWKSPEELQGWKSPEDLVAMNQQISELQSQLAALSGTVAERDATIAQYETDSVKTRVAMETGLPYGMAERLSGDTEEAIRADAQTLLGMMGSGTQQPSRSTEPAGGDPTTAAWNSMLSSMTN